jgi:SAM-dependent methyltransferase
MALLKSCLTVLAPHLKDARILSLGYPDLAVSADDIHNILGVRPTVFQELTHYPETVHVFEQLGCSLRCVDIVRSRRVEEVLDMNHPHDLGQYDLVLDAGTIEHCFNIAQALFNAANAVKPGGRVFHTPPMSMLNHGFYNVCPTMLFDFYTQNGWEIEHLAVMENLGRGGALPMHHTGRFKSPSETVIHCLARRDTDAPLKFPRQTKYMKAST